MTTLLIKYDIELVLRNGKFQCSKYGNNRSIELIQYTLSELNYFSTLQFLKHFILVKYHICNHGIHHPQESPYCFYMNHEKVYFTTIGHESIPRYVTESFDSCSLEEFEEFLLEIIRNYETIKDEYDKYFEELKFEIEFQLNYGSGLDNLISLYGNVMNISLRNNYKLSITDFKDGNYNLKIYNEITSLVVEEKVVNRINLKEKVSELRSKYNM